MLDCSQAVRRRLACAVLSRESNGSLPEVRPDADLCLNLARGCSLADW